MNHGKAPCAIFVERPFARASRRPGPVSRPLRQRERASSRSLRTRRAGRLPLHPRDGRLFTPPHAMARELGGQDQDLVRKRYRRTPGHAHLRRVGLHELVLERGRFRTAGYHLPAMDREKLVYSRTTRHDLLRRRHGRRLPLPRDKEA